MQHVRRIGHPATGSLLAVGCAAWMIALALGGPIGCEVFGRTPRADRPATTSPIPRTQPTEEQERLITDAHAARTAGDYETALSLFREILAENPTVATAYVGIGDVYADQGDYRAAEPAYSRAARLEPRNFDAQFGHGLSLQMLERFIEAVRAYHRALLIRPDSPSANLNLAITYLQMSEPASARVFAERAVELEPHNGAARINLGAAYDELDMHNEAVEQYRMALEYVDPTPEILLNLIKSLSSARRYRETIDTAEQLNRIQPDANAWERIGNAWFHLKDFERSSEAYQQAVDLDPSHWPSWNGIGVNALNRWLLSKKRDAEARDAAGEALRQSLRLNANQQKVIQLISTYRL